MAIRGTLLCGAQGMKGATVRLFRIYQKDAVDDLSQLLGQVHTGDTGYFQIEGSTSKFPSTQTEIEPFVTIHHNCDMDPRQTANLGYKRWAIRLPADYVTTGSRARKNHSGVLNADGPYNDLRWPADLQGGAFILPDESGTNSPTPKGWKARLARADIDPGFDTGPKVYDFGKVNLQLAYPGEMHDKKFNYND